MNKFQNLSFNSIGEFLDFLPEREVEIVEELQKLVYECIPDVKEKLSYNVPFFRRNRNICFIWPASVPWGNVPKNGVQLGFTSGHQINDFAGYLHLGTRKNIAIKTFYSVDGIETDLVKAYLFEALEVDNIFGK
ncbi:MAG: DUF1801 domain-containing protein [Balneolaceae bacterium]